MGLSIIDVIDTVGPICGGVFYWWTKKQNFGCYFVPLIMSEFVRRRNGRVSSF